MWSVQYIIDCICAYISAKVLICQLYVSGKGTVYDGWGAAGGWSSTWAGETGAHASEEGGIRDQQNPQRTAGERAPVSEKKHITEHYTR